MEAIRRRCRRRTVKIGNEEQEILGREVNARDCVVGDVRRRRWTDLEEVCECVKRRVERVSVETDRFLLSIWIYLFSQEYCATKKRTRRNIPCVHLVKTLKFKKKKIEQIKRRRRSELNRWRFYCSA